MSYHYLTVYPFAIAQEQHLFFVVFDENGLVSFEKILEQQWNILFFVLSAPLSFFFFFKFFLVS
tara:strand:+ start:44 stop:235 length:192 start_codon:yes stop_codon:yes gene_type:complete